MPTTDLTGDGRYGARTTTGHADYTWIMTRWSDHEQAWTTTVEQRVECSWIPLEFHISFTEEEALKTHRAAVGRHPRQGQARTLPRSCGPDGRCTRCGAHTFGQHALRCRD